MSDDTKVSRPETATDPQPGDPTIRHVVAWMRATYPQNQHAREWADEIDHVFLGRPRTGARPSGFAPLGTVPDNTTLPSGRYREQSLRLRKLALDFLNSEDREDEAGHDHVAALTYLLRTVEDAERLRRPTATASDDDDPSYRDLLVEAQAQLLAASKKWQAYEREYILPCFAWAREAGIDLEALVRERAGHNCVDILVHELMQRRESDQAKDFYRPYRDRNQFRQERDNARAEAGTLRAEVERLTKLLKEGAT